MAITGISNSGLNISEIVTALVNADIAPKAAQLSRLESNTTSTISGLGQLLGSVSGFKTSLDELNDPSLFDRRTSKSGDTSLFSITADTTAGAGNYDIAVESLADNQRIATKGFADTETAIGTGTLTIGQGAESFDITLDADNNTLTGIKDAINNDPDNTGVSATIITDDSGSRLILSSDKLGLSNQLTVSVVDDDGNSTAGDLTGGLSDLVYDPLSGNGSVELNAASDALIKIDGLTVTSESNTISDAIEGVTLSLKSAQSAEDILAGETVNASISLDKSGTQGAIEQFVESYNALIDVTKELTAVIGIGSEDSAPVAGDLVGDASVRQLITQLRRAMVDPGDGEGINTLATLGVTTTKEGRLEIDSSVLGDQLDNNYAEVGEFLADEENGLMGRLSDAIAPYASSTGILQSRVDNMSETLSNVDDQRISLGLRAETMEKRLSNQFISMDLLVGQYNNTLEYITGALKNLPGVVRQSSDN